MHPAAGSFADLGTMCPGSCHGLQTDRELLEAAPADTGGLVRTAVLWRGGNVAG